MNSLLGASSVSWSGLDLAFHMEKLSQENQQRALRVIESYSPSTKGLASYVFYAAFRIANMAKAIFGKSDWQVAVTTIAHDEVRQYSLSENIKPVAEKAECIRINSLLNGVLMARNEPTDNYGYDYEIQCAVHPGLDEAKLLILNAIPNPDTQLERDFKGRFYTKAPTHRGVNFWESALIKKA